MANDKNFVVKNAVISTYVDTASGYRISGNQILSSTALGSTVTNSNLTSVGTITSGIWNAGSVTSSGTITGVNFAAANGSAASPAYDFSNDTNTGMYLVGADTIGFSTNGTIAAAFTSIGNLRLYSSNGSFYTEVSNQPSVNNTLTLPNSGNVTLVAGTMVPTTGTGATGNWNINSASATYANNIVSTVTATDNTFKIPFLNTTGTSSGTYGLLHDGTADIFTYNPSTNILSVSILKSTVAQGTAPFSITSNTIVTNLNSDLLDGQHGSYYLDWTNVTNKPDPTITVTLSGDVNGSGSVTLTDLSSGTVNINNTTIQPNSVALGTDTTGNYVASLVQGTGVTITNNTGEGTTPKISIGQDVGIEASVQFANMVVSGNLTVNGTTTTVNTTNVSVKDTLIELNSGASTSVNDSGILINRGTTGANAFFGWDESTDKFIVGTTTAGGTSTGDLAITAGIIVAGTFEGTATRVGNSLTTGSYLIGSDYDGSTARSWSVDASTTSLASKLVARDASQNIAANTVFADLSGNASTASKVNNTVTFNNSGSGDSSDTTFDGSTARTISYNTIGAAPISSPALTGTPTAPTAAVNTNTTQIATTAFVIAQIADDAPTKTGGGASGTWGIAISGNAATATNATNADNIYAAISSGASAYKVPFLNTTGTSSADYGVLHDSEATFTYNPSTNTLTVGTVVGNLSGNASTATNANYATSAGNAATATNATNANYATSAGNANTLDNLDSTYFLNYNNLSDKPTIGNATITISPGKGLITGGSFTTNQTKSETVTLDVNFADTTEAQGGTATGVVMNPAQTLTAINHYTIGRGESWQNVTGSRSLNTTYTNSLAQPIQVAIFVNSGVVHYIEVSADGSTWRKAARINPSSPHTVCLIIPPGHRYRTADSTAIEQWYELR